MIANNPEQKNKHEYISKFFQKHNRLLSDILLKFKIKEMGKLWKKLAKKSKKRQMVLKQWLLTEENYLVSLGKIKTQIRDVLLDKQLITEFQRNLMFSNIEGMQMLSREMIQILKPHIAKWDPIQTKISDSVIYLASFFKVYKQYCNNYIQSKNIVNRLYENYPDQINQINLKLKMDIQSYLIKPVQRPPKYKLLLESYRKQMRSNHTQFQQLSKAISIYHDVVEANNKAMELQQKKKKLVQLQTTYGNIIERNARFLLLQTIGYINQIPVRVYIFNDLLMVTFCKDINKTSSDMKNLKSQKQYYRIYYDAYSTLRKLRDGFYNVNGLVLIGTQSYIRIHFKNIEDRDNAFDQLNSYIHNYYLGVQERQKLIFKNQTRKQSITNSRKFNNKSLSVDDLPPFLRSTQRLGIQDYCSTRQTFSIQMKSMRASGRKSTCMTKQRNQQIINDYKLERKLSFVFEFIGLEKRADIIYYIIAVETPLPVKQGQYLYLSFQILQDVEAHLIQLFPKEAIPTVGLRPPSCTKQQIQKNFIKLHQQRGLCIEAFLNFVFRNDNISHHINMVALKLGISQLLYEHMMDFDMYCFCDTCSTIQSLLSDLDFLKYIDFQKDVITELVKDRRQKLCISTALRLLMQMQKIPGSSIQSLDQLLFYMDIKQKRLIVPYIFNNRTIHFVKELYKLPVHLPFDSNFQLMNQRVLQIPIYHYTTCRNIIQEIGVLLKVGALRDFGLCVKVINPDKSQLTWILNDDELVIEVITKGLLVNQQSQRKKIFQMERIQHRSALSNCWQSVKNYLSYFFEAVQQQQKPLLQFYIKKIIFLNKEIEIQACKKDNRRRELIVAQIFQRFKQNDLMFSLRDMKEIIAYYYIVRSLLDNQKLVFNNKQSIAFNFKQDYLRNIISQKKSNLLLKEQFYEEVVQRITKISYKKEMLIQNVFIELIEFVSQKIGWCTQRFPVQNQQPQSLYGENKELEIGINRNFLLIFRRNQVTPLVEIGLSILNYRVAGLTLYIDTDYASYRFTGNNLGVMITIIEFYQNLPANQKTMTSHIH